MWSKACTLNRKGKSNYSISSSSFRGFITNQLDELGPLGLLLIKWWSAAPVSQRSRVRIPARAWIFIRLAFRNFENCVYKRRRSYFNYCINPAVPVYDFHTVIISKGKLIVIFIAFLAEFSFWLLLLLFLLIFGTEGVGAFRSKPKTEYKTVKTEDYAAQFSKP